MTALVRQRRMRRADNGVGRATAYAKTDNGVGKATAPPSRHPRSTLHPQTSSFPKYPPHPNFVILRAVAESISPCQRTTQKTQRPLHATMDTATSRSMTALVSQRRMRRADNGVGKATVYAKTPLPAFPEVPAAPKLRHPQSTHRTQTSSSPKYPPTPKLRHSARSRRIHLPLPTHHPENPAPSAHHHGYCDFAQYDGVGKATVYAKTDNGVGKATAPPSPSSPKYPPPPNFVIPEVPKPSFPRRTQTSSFPKYPPPSKLRHSARSRRIHLPLPTHHPENPAPSAHHHGYCDFAQYDGVGKPTAYAKADNGNGVCEGG